MRPNPYILSHPYGPSDYIARFEANRGVGMVGPWKHEDWRIRALWHRVNRDNLAVELEGCAKPSHEWDVAFDTFVKAGADHEKVVRSAWTTRRLERLSDAPLTLPGQHRASNEMEAV